MGKWVDETDAFTEGQRYYKDTYLESCEVLDGKIEASIFSRETGPYEIYFNFGRMYGIVYADADKIYDIREKMKAEIEKEYRKNGEPSSEFINSFGDKYDVQIPGDIFFDDSALMESFGKLMDLWNSADDYWPDLDEDDDEDPFFVLNSDF